MKTSQKRCLPKHTMQISRNALGQIIINKMR